MTWVFMNGFRYHFELLSLFRPAFKVQRRRLQPHPMSLSAPRDRPSQQSPPRWTHPSSPMSHSPAISRPKSEHRMPHTHDHKTHTAIHGWTLLNFFGIRRSSELIQRALMDNDFMKHLEHGEVMARLCAAPFLNDHF